jgi:transposase-like protein
MKIVESVKQGVPKSETARRFGVDRATVKRYCKRLDERGTLEPAKAPGKASKLDEKARKLLLGDLAKRGRGLYPLSEGTVPGRRGGGESKRSHGLPGDKTPLA